LVNKRREFRIGLRAVGVVLVNKRREFQFGRCQCGEGSREGEGEFGDEVCGHVGGGEAWSGESNAADFRTFEIEAVAEEGEHLLDVLIEGADDLLPEAGGAEAGLSFEAASAGGSPGGDDGALPGEAVGVVGEEAAGWMVGCTSVHTYILAIRRDISTGKLNLW